jgi:CHAT domain-containing protein/Flp pilus assembly protein TadD
MRWMAVWSVVFVALLPVPEAARAQLFVSPQRAEADAALEQAIRLFKAGHYAAAVAPARRAVTLFESVNGKDHANVAIALDALGQSYIMAERFKEAVPIFQRSLAIFQKTLGNSNIYTGQSLNYLGVAYQRTGRVAEAVPFHQRALEVYRKSAGVNHRATGEVYLNLAMAYKSMDRPSEAQKFLKQALPIYEKAFGPDHAHVAVILDNLGGSYLATGRFADAEAMLVRHRTILEKTVGARHPTVGQSLYQLSNVYRELGRFKEAEQSVLRAIDIYKTTPGNQQTALAIGDNQLGLIYTALSRYAEADERLTRAVSTFEVELGAAHRDLALPLNNLGHLYNTQGRFGEAEPILRRSLAIAEKYHDQAHNQTMPLNNLALLCIALGRYAEAESLVGRSIALIEKLRGADHPLLINPLNNLGLLHVYRLQLADAEPVLKRSIAILERNFGFDHPDLATPVGNLGLLYATVGRLDESRELSTRAINILQKSLGKIDARVGTTLNNIASMMMAQDKLDEAKHIFEQSIASLESAPESAQSSAGLVYANFASLERKLGNPDRAEVHFQRAAASLEKTLGPQSPELATVLSSYGDLHLAEGRIDAADKVFQRALKIREAVLGLDSIAYGISLTDMANVALVRKDWSAALGYWRRRAAIVVAHQSRGTVDVARDGSALSTQSSAFLGIVRALYRIDPPHHDRVSASVREAFDAAQRAMFSSTAVSLSQTAARSHKGDAQLAELVREQQDLVREWQALEKLQIAALSAANAKRAMKQEKENAARMATIDKRLVQIAASIAKGFPDYLALANPAPSSPEEVQAQLRDDEAMVVLSDLEQKQGAPEETFVWVVTKMAVRWVRAELGTKGLAREVDALRCGLDASAWAAGHCAELTGQLYTTADSEAGKPLPFDVSRAHALYRVLFSGVEDLIKGKELLLVPSGPLTRLPFQVLVTSAPTSSNFKEVRWLTRDHPLTVLPAVSSLKALRSVSKPSLATRPHIGFGNPLLDGAQQDPKFGTASRQRAELAKAYRGCAPTEHARSVVVRGGPSPSANLRPQRGLTNLHQLKSQEPLPETADEVCIVARNLGADLAEMRLGVRATEREIKKLSEAGALRQYRIIHFATHGTLAGQLSDTAEPGLILSPPDQASAEDDGYLSSSEIASLKLDADWVILSACNTAGGSDASVEAEALSGLARAFFYAGARALLVSHWAVASDATVRLISKAAQNISGKRSRATALQHAMLAMIDGPADDAHPTYWAPFVIVGEGG